MSNTLTGYGRQLKNVGITVERLGAGLVTAGALCLALQCYYLLTIPPAQNYELSVFVAYPLAHWVAFGTALVVALGLFLLSGVGRTGHWRQGIVLLAANYGLFFALPLFRNYHLYGRGQADKLLHLANVTTIVETGHFENLFYPLEHVFLSELVVAAGVSRESLTYLLPYVTTFVYILSVAVVVRYFVADRRGLAVGLFVGAPLVFTNFHLSINPSLLSFMFVPLYLWLLERYRRLGTERGLALVVGFGGAFVMFHPMTTALVIGLVATTAVFARFASRFGVESGSGGVGRLSLLLPIPVGVAAFMWNLSPYGPRGLLQAMVLVWLTGGRSVGAGQLSDAAEVSFTAWQLAKQFVSLYGAIFVFLIAAGLIALRVAYDLYRGRADYAETFLSYQFGAGFFVSVMFLAVYFIASNPVRIARYMITMAVLLVGVYLARSLTNPSGRRRVVAAVLVVGVVASALLGAGAAYRANYQMTDTEYQGSEFLVNHFDPSLRVRSLATATKMQAYVLRPDYLDGTAFQVAGSAYDLSPALGYDENRTAAESFGPSYLVTKQYDLEFYQSNTFNADQREAVFLYDESHVRRLTRDPTVGKVYTNGGFEVWLVTDGAANQSG